MSQRSPIRSAVLTVSDGVANGKRQDLSGAAVAQFLSDNGCEVVATKTVADEQPLIQEALLVMCDAARFVVTTGGTGITTRDVTPEATLAVCDKVLPGFAELMRSEGRKQTPFAVLSRAVCGTRGQSLIINLPGSPQGAVQSLAVVFSLVAHALDLLAGKTEH